MCSSLLLQGERIDDIGFGQLKLIQKPEEFCYGVDAVLLADFAARTINKNKKMRSAIDLGTGTAIIPIILSHKTELEKICGVELQQKSFERACRNVTLNKLDAKIKIFHSDVASYEGGLEVSKGTFDVVTTNPPYMVGGTGLTNDNEAKRIARHETTADLDTFVKESATLLRDKGELFMVHRPSRLVDICISCRKYKLEPKELRFIAQSKNAKPNILLIRCVKFGNPELKMLENLYIYEEDSINYTKEIKTIYERLG